MARTQGAAQGKKEMPRQRDQSLLIIGSFAIMAALLVLVLLAFELSHRILGPRLWMLGIA
jgi:hypothetical protein